MYSKSNDFFCKVKLSKAIIMPLNEKLSSLLFRSLLLAFLFLMLAFTTTMAQPPSHDPSTMVRNTDGRYWVFTTGQGVWCMSSSNANFTDWRAEPTPFGNGWPGWINNYVSGFSGDFWAPDVIEMNGSYYLYYSVSSFGSSTSAIGVARANNLAGPWTDLGVVVSSNSNNDINAIDPGMFRDTDGRVWMTYGSWFGGIGIVEVNPSTGKTIGGVTHLLGGNHQSMEAPYIIKNGCYYYLFINHGSCCDGLNSSYYVNVLRSTNITGPYTGERLFLSNRYGDEHGPGHVGYGEGRLTYHYYDVSDNGAAKLANWSLGWGDGWPVPNGSGGWESCSGGSSGGGDNGSFNGTYSIIASHSGKALDTYNWGTSNGTNIVQWNYWGGDAQRYNISQVDGDWHRITPAIASGQALDVDGISTSDGANIHTWSYWGGEGQQFRFQSAGSGIWQIIARNSGKCFDVENNSSEDGANVMQWSCISGAANQMFEVVTPNSASVENGGLGDNAELNVYPNPVSGDLININTILDNPSNVNINIYNTVGKQVYSETIKEYTAGEILHRIDVSDLNSGTYILKVTIDQKTFNKPLLIQ